MSNFDAFFNGYELEIYKHLGSHYINGGMRFRCFAPNARDVFVFTSKNWNNFYKMHKIDDRGIFETYIENMEPIYSYRYKIETYDNQYIEKIDPYSHLFELRPSNASVMYDLNWFKFDDLEYLKKRDTLYNKPLNIYEIHLNGFKKDPNYKFTSYQQIKKDLIPYLLKMGYNFVEFMPVFEHPFDGSWGYQATGFFASTSRYGSPYDLMDLINELHKNNIGVILDVVYAHFANDKFALKQYDGTSLYEYDDTQQALSQWDTYYFDLNKGFVQSFLMSSANFFLKEMHFDGLRFDAVSHFIHYHGNKQKGENREGLAFLKRINHHLKQIHPKCIIIAEDSSDYHDVTKPSQFNGLGFDYKWDLGWMNDTLKYYALDPEYKKYHHNLITFSMHYFNHERFLLPFSHDEVVHSKKTIIDKMWGDYETKFRLCRNLFIYMYSHPGKKLNFIGNDIASFREFDEDKQIDWFLLDYPVHDSFNRFIRDINNIYLYNSALSSNEYDSSRFRWIDADNASQSIYSYFRYDEKQCIVTVLNMMPHSYDQYLLGVPFNGYYEEIINSEKDIYSGCNMCNYKPILASNKFPMHNLKYSIKIKIAPYSAIMFKVKVDKNKLKDI